MNCARGLFGWVVALAMLVSPAAARAAVDVTLNGESVNVALSAGQVVDLAFDATAGQRLNVLLDQVEPFAWASPSSMVILSPDGTPSATCSSGSTPIHCRISPLRETGRYVVRLTLDPGGLPFGARLTVSADVEAVLAPFVQSTVQIARPGQRAHLVFPAGAHAGFGIGLSGASFQSPYAGGVRVTLVGPDGQWIATSYAATQGPTVLSVEDAGAGGAYAIDVVPDWDGTGQISVMPVPDAEYVVSPDGSPVALALARFQNAKVRFVGASGANLGIGMAGVTASFVSTLVSPQGYVVTTCSLATFTSYGDCNVPPLPADGSYELRLQRTSEVEAQQLDLYVSSDAVVSLQADAPAQRVAVARPGTNVRTTFHAVAGENLVLTWLTTPDPYLSTSVYLYGPGDAGSWINAVGLGNDRLHLGPAPATGTFLAIFDLSNWTGSFDLALLHDLQAPITIGGPPLAIDLVQGQTGRFAFRGAAGQRLGLAVASLKASGTLTIRVQDEGGSLVLLDELVQAPGRSLTLPPLPADAAYTITVSGFEGVPASLQLWLTEDLQSTLVPSGGAVRFAPTRPGTNAWLGFNAAAGSNMSLLARAATSRSNWIPVKVLSPTGQLVAASQLASAAGSTVQLNLPSLQVSGTYHVSLDPADNDIEPIDVSLAADATAPIVVDGPAAHVVLAAGQNGRLTFQGRAGMRLGIGASVSDTGLLALAVVPPRGAAIPCSSGFSSNGCALPTLVHDGVYTLTVTSTGGAPMEFDLWLSQDVSATLTTDGHPYAFDVLRPGRNANLGFPGIAGWTYEIVSTGSGASGWISLKVIRPDGVVHESRALQLGFGTAAARVDLANAYATGTYTIRIDPEGSTLGAVTVAASAVDPAATTSADAPLPIGSVIALAGWLAWRVRRSARPLRSATAGGNR